MGPLLPSTSQDDMTCPSKYPHAPNHSNRLTWLHFKKPAQILRHRRSLLVLGVTLLLFCLYTRLGLPLLGRQSHLASILKNTSRSSVYKNNCSVILSSPNEKKETTHLKSGKPPTVNRSILDKLNCLHLNSQDDLDDLPWLKALSHPNLTKPPLITHIPSTHPHPHPPPAPPTTPSIDSHFCSYHSHSHSHPPKCRFLLPSYIPEQLSKSHLHLTQLILLSRLLNRTLVFPNVGRSRMGACARWEGGMYWDVEKVILGVREWAGAGGGGGVVEMEEFKRWLVRRPDRPAAQMVQISPLTSPRTFLATQPPTLNTMERNGIHLASYLPANFDLDGTGADATGTTKSNGLHEYFKKRSPCLSKSKYFSRMDFSRYPLLSIRLPDNASSSTPAVPTSGDQGELNVSRSIGLDLVDLLHEQIGRSSPHNLPGGLTSTDETPANFPQTRTFSHGDENAEVLVIDYDLRHPIFPSLPPLLAYSPRLVSLADVLISRVGNGFLGVHWRMESVPREGLGVCVGELVGTIERLLSGEGKGMKDVWLATDYPFPISGKGGRRSGTFRSITAEHVDAMNVLKSAFGRGGRFDGVRLWGLDEVLPLVISGGRSERWEEGDELLEDEGVLGILDKLVVREAVWFVSGAKGCGRVREIVDYRKEAVEQGRGLRNVVDLFG
ncbi:hypothetical protein JAAARDRAFT_81001 [Jaapia argillacea MUCL 33604]|uniref:Uncharacterized protein n=1 Tax=Jaapia argillacea MUCL 33604 TaxID=933084 RepID=A0A067PD97_9AGAM|nr:hypothetical protein JAAARDRAFT_81001 [Jaapia argillacea MUCL 33604]